MEYSKFEKHVKYTDSFTAREVNELEPKTDEEMDVYIRELAEDSGNLSGWDHLQVWVTFKEKIEKLEEKIEPPMDGKFYFVSYLWTVVGSYNWIPAQLILHGSPLQWAFATNEHSKTERYKLVSYQEITEAEYHKFKDLLE